MEAPFAGEHAPKRLRRFTSGDDPGRFVVEVDEDGHATMRPAEPRRS
jgi:hypothetical protein